MRIASAGIVGGTMSTRQEIISGFYGRSDEDRRLFGTRHGQLEYRTTMTYIRRYAGRDPKVLEIGAGTVITSLILSRVFLKETLSWLQYLLIGIILAGIIALALLGV